MKPVRRLVPLLMAPLLLAAAACAARDAPAPAQPGRLSRAESRGERLFHAQCGGCHALEPGANTAAAPTLAAIVGKPIAAEPGYNYSPALRALAGGNGVWTEALLDRFVADPAATVPGTEMGYPGLADAGARSALIGWLRSNPSQ